MVMYLKADMYIKYKNWMKMGFAHSWLECKKQRIKKICSTSHYTRVRINVAVDKILNGLYNEHIHYTC